MLPNSYRSESGPETTCKPGQVSRPVSQPAGATIVAAPANRPNARKLSEQSRTWISMVFRWDFQGVMAPRDLWIKQGSCKPVAMANGNWKWIFQVLCLWEEGTLLAAQIRGVNGQYDRSNHCKNVYYHSKHEEGLCLFCMVQKALLVAHSDEFEVSTCGPGRGPHRTPL